MDDWDERTADIELRNEVSFITYAENVVYKLQMLWRQKEDMEYEPVLEMCERLEDHVFRKALIQCHPVPQGSKFQSIYDSSFREILFIDHTSLYFFTSCSFLY
jgi:hypothetical protein